MHNNWSMPALILILSGLVGAFAVAEIVPSTPLKLTIQPLPLEQLNRTFAYKPRRAAFSDNFKTALCYADPEWNKLTYEDRAGMIDDMFRILLSIHQSKDESDPRYRFSSRILTCKLFKESGFNTQIGNVDSTAVGLSQVLEGTAADVLGPRNGFRSKVQGYEHIGDYETYQQKMAEETTLQLELGLAVMEMKRRDFNLNVDDARPFLRRYFGSRSEAANDAYANSIFNCAACVKANDNFYSQECLCKAKPEDKRCMVIKKSIAGDCNL